MFHAIYEFIWHTGTKVALAMLAIDAWFDKLKLWLWTMFFVGGVCFFSGTRRGRMSHNNGITGRGKIKFVTDGKWPAADFFEPGKELPCRVRHAAAAYGDDAMKLVRSMSIKCADARWESPLDLEMNTGVVTFFWSAYQFMQFAFNRNDKDGIEYVKYYAQMGRRRCGARAGFRRAAESLMAMTYQTQTAFEFKAKDGKLRYVKFRSIRADGQPEGGLIPDEPQETAEQIGNQQMLPGETNNRNYVKHLWREQVAEGEAKYTLQMQLHEWTEESYPEHVFNSNYQWDEETHPWMDLAHVQVDEVLDEEENWWTSFGIANMPPSVRIIPAKSIHDYNSLNYMRSKSWPARKLRYFFARIFGIPKPIPDGPRPPFNIVPSGG